jgi:hypothetical protein
MERQQTQFITLTRRGTYRFNSFLLLHCLFFSSGSCYIYEDTVTKPYLRHINIDMDIATSKGNDAIIDQRQDSPTMQHDKTFSSPISPRLLSNLHTGATTDQLQRRRAQTSASCSANPSCAAAGLTGDCCPPIGGTNLFCCSQTAPSTCLTANVNKSLFEFHILTITSSSSFFSFV